MSFFSTSAIFKYSFIPVYSAAQKFGISKIFNVFERSFFCLSRLYLFDQKYRKKLLLWNIIAI